MRRPCTIPAIALLALAACAPLADYAHDRGGDAADILRFHVMAGFGADAMLEATRALRLGAGQYEAACAGLHRRAFGTWHERVEEGGAFFMHGRFESVTGIPRVSGSYGTMPPWGPARLLQADETWVDLFVVRATAMAGLGVDVEVRLGQLLDFVGGLFLWDPARDDEPPSADG
jgi:hypothetical protein